MSLNSPKPTPGKALYVLFQGGTPIEVTAYPARAVARAQEWSTVNNPCIVAGCKVEYLFGDVDEQSTHSVQDVAEESPASDHESACGLGKDCPRKVQDLSRGIQSLTEDERLNEEWAAWTLEQTQKQLEFEFEEPTRPDRLAEQNAEYYHHCQSCGGCLSCCP